MRLRTAAPRVALLALVATACGPRHSYPDGSGLEGQLEREVIALNQRIRALQEQVAHCGHDGDAGPLFAELTQVFAGTEIDVHREGALVVVTLPMAHLYGDPALLRFRDECTMTLDLLATALNLHPDRRIQVEGHTGDRELEAALALRFRTRLALSYQLAEGVMRRLSLEFGVSEDRFTVAGRGHWDPISPNDLPGGQDRNDRVEVQVFPPGAR